MAELHPLLRSFYNEIDPEKRYSFLTAYEESMDGSLSPADKYRIDLFNSRHLAAGSHGFFGFTGWAKKAEKKAGCPQGKSAPLPPGNTDSFLREILVFLSIYKNAGFRPKRHQKEILAALRRLRLDDRPEQDEACAEVFYLEMRNAVRRYFSTCHDSSYGRKLFGLSSSNDREKECLRCFDTWNFSFGIARMLDLTEEMELICRAANDEYCASVPDAESLPIAFKQFGGNENRH